jgi:hypothetical protein
MQQLVDSEAFIHQNVDLSFLIIKTESGIQIISYCINGFSRSSGSGVSHSYRRFLAVGAERHPKRSNVGFTNIYY